MLSPLVTKVKNLEHDTFHTLMVTGALFASSFFSYLLQLYLGRTMSLPSYGAFTALLSIFTMFSYFYNICVLIFVKKFSRVSRGTDNSEAGRLYGNALANSAIIGFGFGLLILLLTPVLANKLGINSFLEFILLAGHVGSFFLLLAPSSFLQGKQMFLRFSALVVVTSILRLMCPIIFSAILGHTVVSAFGGIFISYILSVVVGLFLVGIKPADLQLAESFKLFLQELRQYLPYISFTLCMGLFVIVDVIAGKIRLTDVEAGLYSSVTVVGRIILFGAGSVSTVLYPRISALSNDRLQLRLLVNKFFKLQLLLLVSSVFVFLLVPGFVVKILFGDALVINDNYVRLYAVFIGLWVLCSFFLTVLLAIDVKRVFYFLPLFVLVQILLVALGGYAITTLLLINIFVSACLTMFAVISFWKYSRNTLK